MKTDNEIRELCESKTFLDENNIKSLIEASKILNIMANIDECDIFIDVFSRDKNTAIVIFHARPSTNKSIYVGEVVGAEVQRKNEPGVLKTLETGVPCKDIKAVTQENKIVRQKIHPIKSDEGEVIAVVIAENDIANEVEEDFKLDKDKNELGNLIESNTINNVLAKNLDDSVLIFTNKGKLAIKNNNATSIYKKLGYIEEIIGMSYDNLSLDNMKFNDLIEDLKGKKKIVKEIKFGDYYFKVSRIYIDNNRKYKLIVVIKDITYIRKKEKDIKLKEVEMKEANHRIKNNLQATVALLRRESKSCINEISKTSLESCISRILTIASTHDLLSKSSENKVSARAAIKAILKNIGLLEDKDIKASVIGDDFEIYGRQETALLLSINEIIINSYKHGFKGLDSGNIEVLINRVDKNITITIKDNGNGYCSKKADFSGLGMGIIESYVTEVLNGKITINSDESGTSSIIKFKLT